MTNDLKLKIYPAVIGILGVCLVASLLFNVEIQVEQEPSTPETVPVNPDRTDTDFSETLPQPSPSVSDLETPESPPVAAPSPANPELDAAEPIAAAPVTIEGGLRVSNQTEYPLRLALLHHASEATAESTPEEKSAFNQPVHWDFAPEEGRRKGLIVSLPNDDLKLQSGDVLVAFALDGSRRYWGPYVVGETSLPTWNEAAREWQLILRP